MFKPGQSGNPAGRKPGTRDRRTAELETLLHGSAQEIVLKVVERALAGDGVALKLAMERLSPVRKGRPLEFELPLLDSAADLAGTLGAVLTAISVGELTPEEGHTIAGIVELRRRSIETAEFEKRIVKLETALTE